MKQAHLEAYERFFRAHYAQVVRALYLIVHDEELAADVAQDAFAHTLRNWKRVSRYDRPDAWVRRVAVRAAVKSVRRERLRSKLETSTHVAKWEPSRDLDLIREIGALPPTQRAAIALFYYEDMSVHEVADVLGCSSSTVKVHLHKARKRLALVLQPEVSDAVG